MWKNWDPTPYTREAFAARVERLPRLPWCRGITLHNTSAPTLAQWAESGPRHDARLRNLESYYEQEKGWHAGPHLFVSREFINGFSDLTRPGVHSRCFNSTHIGIEMVGDYDSEHFDDGDGAKVRDNAVFAMAVLFRKLDLEPEDNLTFHRECTQDNHACPGRRVSKADIIARVRAEMDRLEGPAELPQAAAPIVAPTMSWTVKATEFGGDGDEQQGAYGPWIHPDQPEVGLPAKLPAGRRTVKVSRGGTSIVCRVTDLGPWNKTDDYWDRGERPRAEAQMKDRRRAENGQVPTNAAGIDLTRAAMDALDVPGKPGTRSADVTWEFTDEEVAALEPSSEVASASMPVPNLPQQTKSGFGKLIAWVSGTGIGGALSVLYDWRVLAILLFAIAVLIALFVDIRHMRSVVTKWLTGSEPQS